MRTEIAAKIKKGKQTSKLHQLVDKIKSEPECDFVFSEKKNYKKKKIVEWPWKLKIALENFKSFFYYYYFLFEEGGVVDYVRNYFSNI